MERISVSSFPKKGPPLYCLFLHSKIFKDVTHVFVGNFCSGFDFLVNCNILILKLTKKFNINKWKVCNLKCLIAVFEEFGLCSLRTCYHLKTSVLDNILKGTNKEKDNKQKFSYCFLRLWPVLLKGALYFENICPRQYIARSSFACGLLIASLIFSVAFFKNDTAVGAECFIIFYYENCPLTSLISVGMNSLFFANSMGIFRLTGKYFLLFFVSSPLVSESSFCEGLFLNVLMLIHI